MSVITINILHIICILYSHKYGNQSICALEKKTLQASTDIQWKRKSINYELRVSDFNMLVYYSSMLVCTGNVLMGVPSEVIQMNIDRNVVSLEGNRIAR